jgi:helicase
MDPINKLALETIQMGKQALIFCPSRASTEKTAEDLSKLTNLNHPEFENEVLKTASVSTKQCQRLAKIVKKGIAFHHAGLLQKQKDLIEDEFRSKKIKVICATTSLAAGLSLPAFRVIIKSLKRFSGSWGMDWIPVLEYMQMAGRAGRPEHESTGQSIVIATDESQKQEIYDKYICGVPEEIYSKLAVEPVLRTYLLSLISSGIIRDEKSMKNFFAKTFWAHQYNDMPKLELIMDKMLSLLQEWEFVKIIDDNEEQGDFVTATNIDKPSVKKFKATLLGKRISELYLDPLTARHLLDCLKEYGKDKNEFSLLQMISHTLELRPLLRVKSKQQDYIQEELIKNYELLLKDEPSAYDAEYSEFMNSIKTALFFESWISENTEDFLLEKFDIRPGEIRYKLEAADWLLYAAEELGKLLLYNRAVNEIRRLRIRVKHGIKKELVSLIKLKGIGRLRARKMFSNNLKDLGDLKNVDISSLSQLIGSKLAESVKKQVGEEIFTVPRGTRKGQLSLEKY